MSPPGGNPAVTVIIATFDSSATLRLSLRSALAQEIRELEVWVVGDACTDDSQHAVTELGDPRVDWINLERNTGGQAGPNNEGLRRARGEYIAYLGHDDLWFPWHLGHLLQHARATGADLVHSLCPCLAPEGVYAMLGAPPEGTGYDRHFVPPSCWLHRRSLVQEIGPWRAPDTLGHAVDFDYLRRAALAGKKIACLPDVTLLKLPSARWRAYARRGTPPQEALWQEMMLDPVGLHRRTLVDFADYQARHSGQYTPLPVRLALRETAESLHRLRRSVLYSLVDRYGQERWPVGNLLRLRHRRRRSAQRRSRGLPPR